MRTSTKTLALTDSTQATPGHSLVLPPLEFGARAEVTTDYILAMLNDDPELLALEALQPTPSHTKVRRALRELVDEWLDSGLDVSGSETPKDRNFEESPKSQKALVSFSKSGGLLLLPHGKTFSLYFNDENLPLAFDGNGFEEIVRPQIAFILLSGLRERLAKCRKCNTYFLLKYLGKTYSRGTKCGICNRASRSENSVKATASVRANAVATLHKLAATRFQKKLRGVASWQKDKALKAAIAEYLNIQIQRSDTLRPIYYTAKRKGITGKWTAQDENWKGINKALKVAKR